MIYNSTYLFNIIQCIDTIGSNNLIDLIFPSLRDLCIAPVDTGLVTSGNYNAPLIINIYLPFATCIQNYVYS
jgi:hypothetical protein